MRLKGKKALITGASRGIGRGIAEVFAEEGADVAVNYIESAAPAEDVVKGIQAHGRKAIAVKGDVAKRADVEAMIDKAWKELGGLDILVNNAGIETIVPFLELTDDQWTRLVDVNLRGPWLCSQVFCRKAIAEKRKGSIVHIGSIQAAKVLPGRTHYAPTKLGLEALTRNMSAEVTPQGIRVNCVHPGLIDTDMTAWVMKSPDILPLVLQQISLGRAGEPARNRHGRRVLRVRRGELSDRAVGSRRRRMARQIVIHALVDWQIGGLEDWQIECTRLIDLSMEVFQGMMTYPNVAKPVIVEMETYSQMAQSVGTDKFGVNEITNHCMIVTGDHIGTHIDSWGHVNPTAPRAEGIPIEYCYGDGVVLDLTHKAAGDEITVADIEEAEKKLGGYTIKALDIVLLRTDAAKKRLDKAYLTDHPGMTKESVHYMLDRGVKVMGIDAIGFDPPVAKMFERKKFWEAHRVMREREYYHLENMCNLHEIPAPYHSFTVSVLPVKWRGASAAPVRAVAIIAD